MNLLSSTSNVLTITYHQTQNCKRNFDMMFSNRFKVILTRLKWIFRGGRLCISCNHSKYDVIRLWIWISYIITSSKKSADVKLQKKPLIWCSSNRFEVIYPRLKLINFFSEKKNIYPITSITIALNIARAT